MAGKLVDNTDTWVASKEEFSARVQGKCLCGAVHWSYDAPFSTITFTHFLEDRIRETLAMPFYEAEPRDGTVIDAEGNRLSVPTLVISDAANAARREHRLVEALERIGAIRRARVGNTRLALLDCRTMVDTVDRMVASGDSFFADGRRIH